ncbi:MAG: hypothetical protein AAGG44_17830 [Planctomycetota bacterium]
MQQDQHPNLKTDIEGRTLPEVTLRQVADRTLGVYRTLELAVEACTKPVEPKEDEVVLSDLWDRLSELVPLYQNSRHSLIGRLATLLEKVPPYSWVGRLLRRPAPQVRKRRYLTLIEFDISSRSGRVVVGRLIRLFDTIPQDDLHRIAAFVKAERENFGYHPYSERSTKRFAPVQIWFAWGLLLAWATLWSTLLTWLPSFSFESIAQWFELTILGNLSGLLLFVMGCFLIVGRLLAHLEQIFHEKQLALIERWLNLYCLKGPSSNSQDNG